MERKSNTENCNPYQMKPNNNSYQISFSENGKFNKLFCNNNNSSKHLVSNNKTQYCSSNTNKNKIIFSNKINELGDLNLNDSLYEIKLNNNFDPKIRKNNSHNHYNGKEIKSYNFKEKENALNRNKYCFYKLIEKELNILGKNPSNNMNNLTDDSSINLNNNSSIKNNVNPNVNFHFSSNSKDRNSKYSNSNTLQNISTSKIKNNEFFSINSNDKQKININKFKDTQNKMIENNILKNYISKNYNNIKLSSNTYFNKNEYLNIKDKIKNKITNQDNNSNFKIIENMNGSLGKLCI